MNETSPPEKHTEPTAATGGPIIQVRDLTKSFRIGDTELPVLRGVDLDVARGEWLGLFGRSGSGKSTLLHLIGGLDSATSGTIDFEDQQITRLRGRKLDKYRSLRVGFVFQSYHLLPELTALENVAIAAKIAGGPRKSAHRKPGNGKPNERAIALLERVGLKDRMKHRPAKLSGGERQRVAIARALINEPGVLLADEPTGNLDAETGASIIELLHTLHDDGQTILMVTHDESIVDHADRVVRLVRGQIDRSNTPS